MLVRRRAVAGVVLATIAATGSGITAATAGAHPPSRSPRLPNGAELALQWYDITDQSVRYAADATKVPLTDPDSLNEPATQSRVWAVSWLAAARAVDRSRNPVFHDAAFAEALHDTLVDQIPSQQATIDTDLSSSLAALPDGTAKTAGVAAGRREATKMLAQRAGDGLDRDSIDTPWTTPAPAPGIWQPTVTNWATTPPTVATAAVRAGQGKARSFLLRRNDQFQPPAPPSLTSKTYLDSLAEVRAYGAVDSTVRTATQTDVAKFWIPATNFVYYQLLRGILVNTSAPLTWTARLIAAFHVVTSDAQIAIYNAKYVYVRWRPETAIDVTSTSDPGVAHSWTTFAAITDEVINARVWEGIHFRFSDVIGADVGHNVGDWDLRNLHALGL
jgi:hypothetical protein